VEIDGWSRWDQMLLEGALRAVPVVGVLSLAPGVADAVRGLPLEVDPSVGGGRQATTVLTDPTTGQHLLALAPHLLGVAAVTVAALLLLGVARALRHGDPFTPSSARRLTALGFLVLVAGLLGPAVAELLRLLLLWSTPAAAQGWTFSAELSLWPVLAGMLVLFVAEVFRRGAALRADVEGLV
jgi:hypothetical protein